MKKNVSIILLIFATSILILWQKDISENRFTLQENKIVILEDALLELSAQNDAVSLKLRASDEKYEQLAAQLLSLKYDTIHNSLPAYWSHVWNDISKANGALTTEQIEEVNFLLQPVFSYNDRFEVNPLSCFFTSYYKDIRAIDLAEFLRYFPDEERLKNFPEFEALKEHENWPFEFVDSEEQLPVPIHRYPRERVQDAFTTYTGISLESLTGVESDEVIYLDHTDAYYNFTSDLAPGVFNCEKGMVEGDIIKLYSTSKDGAVLIIVKEGKQYVIKSLYVE